MSEWSEAEFETLLNNPQLSDEELKKRLPGRTIGAVKAVREAVQDYYGSGNFSATALSKMMKQMLQERQGS